MVSDPAASNSDPFLSEGLLLDLLAVSLTAANVLRPVYDAGELVDFELVYLNAAAQRSTGLGERPGGTLRERFPHSVAAGVFDYYRSVFETGGPLTYQSNYQADGLNNYFKFAARRSGEWLVVSFTDTSDQDRSAVEQALRASQAAEQHARAEAESQRRILYEVLMQLPAYVAVYQGPDHIYQFVNPPYQRIFPHRSFLGRPFREGIPEANALGVLALFDRVYQTGEPYYGHEMEGWFDFDGTGQPQQLFFNLFLHPLRDAQGRIDGVLDFSYDVSEQVRARRKVEQLNQELEARVQQRTQQLLTQGQRLERLFMQVPAAVCILGGPDFVFELVNPAYQRLLPGRQLLGRPFVEAVPELAAHAAVAVFRQVYATGATHQEQAMLVPVARASDGVLEERYFNYVQQARFDEHGRVDGVLVFAFEVTEEVRARQQAQDLAAELTATNARLTRTNADLDNFIYTASHDLKAPIANIEGLLDALRHQLSASGLNSEVAHLLNLMQGAAERFKRTIGHLTDVSRLQQEHDQPNAQVALAALIEEVRLDLAPLLRETRARLAIDVPAGLTLTFSEKNLRSIVYNLLSNALKYRHPDRVPEVHVCCQPQPGFQVLEVEDNGLGLDLSRGQHQLFAMFQRLHTHVEGTGIGLYMVKKMIENAGGRIEVESLLGQGSTFRVYFAV